MSAADPGGSGHYEGRAALHDSPCPGHGGVWTSVELLPGGEGGLYASYGDQKVLLAP